MAAAEMGWVNQLNDIPVITRWYTALSLLVTLACNFDFVSQFDLYLNPDLVIQRFQVWRLVTPFLYAGPFNFGTAFNLLFTYRYSRLLEDHCFHRRRADYLFMILIVATIILFLATPMNNMLFLGSALSHAILYVWCRRNAFHRVMILGLLVLRADQVHFVLVGLSILTGSSLLTSDLIALLAGHVYYFLEDVFPRQPLGFKIIKTPKFLKALFNELDEEATAEESTDNGPQVPAANENNPGDPPAAAAAAAPLLNDVNDNPIPGQEQFL